MSGSKNSLAMPQWALPVLTPEGGLTPQWGYFFQGLLARAQQTSSSTGELSLAQNAFALGMLDMSQPPQVGQFEPLLDVYKTVSTGYVVQLSDTGLPLVVTGINSVIYLPSLMRQGVKVVISCASSGGLTIQGGDQANVNGVLDGYVYLPYGESAICEVINNNGIFAAWSVIISGNLAMIYENIETGNLNTIVLGGDLSLEYGAPPIIQSAQLNDFSTTVTLSLPGTVTPGNMLVLAVGGGQTGYVATPTGYTSLIGEAIASATMYVFYQIVSAATENYVVLTGDNSAGGSHTFASLREWGPVSSITASYSAGVTAGTYLNSPYFGSLNTNQSAFYGFVVQGATELSTFPPSFSNPYPLSATIASSFYANPAFEGVYTDGCEIVLANANGSQQINVWDLQPPATGWIFGIVQLVGVPQQGGNTATLVGTPTLVIDGYTIAPTITTSGMIEFTGPDTLAAYLTVEQNGTLLSSTITELNFTGNTDPLSLSGTTLNVPAQSFVEGTLTATGIATLMGDISLIGTANPTIYAPPLVAGNNITITGSNTISGAATIAANTAFENNGTYLGLAGTINAGTNLTASSSGGVITFSAPAVAGALTLLSSQTISGAGSVNFPASGTLSAGYNYYIEGEAVQCTSSGQIAAQFGAGGGPTWDTLSTSYIYGWTAYFTTGATGNTASEMILGNAAGSAAAGGQTLQLWILGDPGAATNHTISGNFSSALGSFLGFHVLVEQITGLRLIPTAGNISGVFKLYSIVR